MTCHPLLDWEKEKKRDISHGKVTLDDLCSKCYLNIFLGRKFLISFAKGWCFLRSCKRADFELFFSHYYFVIVVNYTLITLTVEKLLNKKLRLHYRCKIKTQSWPFVLYFLLCFDYFEWSGSALKSFVRRRVLWLFFHKTAECMFLSL